MRRRHQNRLGRIPPVFRKFQKTLCGLLKILVFTFMNKAAFLERIKRGLEISPGAIVDSLPVVRGLLPPDLRKVKFGNLRMGSQQTKKIAAFDGGMLFGVADEQHPVVVLIGKPDDLRSFPERIQTGFVNDHIAAFRRLPRRLQKTCDGTRQLEAFAFQNIDRAVGRSDQIDMLHPAAAESPAQLLQRRSFPGTRHAPEQVVPVFRLQQRMNDSSLFASALFSWKCDELRCDRFQQLLLAFYCFNRVQLPVDHLLS